jgi:DNA-binding SARP family transcriptional activator
MMVRGGDATPAPTVIEFRFLGRFAVRSGEAWHPGPPAKKGGWLMQYLGCYPQRVATREELARAFWPGLPVEDAAHRIHLAVSGARTYLRGLFDGIDALECVGNGYCWTPAVRIASDAERLLEYTRRNTLESHRAALDLYGGEFLAGETSGWLQSMRIRLAAARDRALEKMATELIARDEWGAALDYALDLINSERGHEAATRLVMRCFAELGQPARALQQYRLLVSYLAEQIGVEPSPETTALAARLFPRALLAV